MLRSTYGSRGIANFRYFSALKLFGEEHPATKAALGRLRARKNVVPQKGLLSIEAIAWHRESGANPGFRNRTARKHA
jgi:hypothetical protein